jgi:hypothetical protein
MRAHWSTKKKKEPGTPGGPVTDEVTDEDAVGIGNLWLVLPPRGVSSSENGGPTPHT